MNDTPRTDSLSMNIAQIIAERADHGYRGMIEGGHLEAAYKILELLEIPDLVDFGNQVVLVTHELDILAKKFGELPDELRGMIVTNPLN